MIKETMIESACPYCGSIFENNEVMSKHIDKIHNNEDAASTQKF